MRQQNTNETNPAALVYCRVSTEKQSEEGTSLDSQAAACIEYAKQNGYQVAEVVKETFSGAYLFDRPLLNEQRAKIRAGEYGAVIVYAIDRLSRDIAHLAILSDEIERHGAKLHFVTESLDNTPEGKLMLSVRSYVAEVERLKIRERSIRGRMSKLYSGKMVAHSCDLYGYTVDRKNAVRIVKEDEAAIIRRIFSEYLADRSIRAIVRNLNADNVPPPSAGKKTFKHDKFKTVKEYGANFWGVSTISKILANEAYTGKAYANQYGSRTVFVNGSRKIERYVKPRNEWIELPGTTPAIISTTIFDAAQNRKSNTAGAKTRNETRPVLLRGLVFCKCGRVLCPEFTRGRKPGQEFLYYRCASRGKKPCPYYFGNVSGSKLDAAVWGKVEALITHPEIIRLEIEQRIKGADSDKAIIEADVIATKQTIGNTKTQIAKLVERIATMDDAVFELVNRQINEKSKELKRLEGILTDAENRLKNFNNNLARLASLQVYADTFKRKLASVSFDERRTICEAFGVKVVVNSKDEINLTLSIPVETEVINLSAENRDYEDLRCNGTYKQSNTCLSRRSENRVNYGKSNKIRRSGEFNGASVFCPHGDAR